MAEFVVSSPMARYLVRQPVGGEHEVDVVPGLRHDMVQSFDLVVSQQRSTQLYTVVLATLPALSAHDRAVIAQALAATRRPELVFVVEASPDQWVGEAPAAQDPVTAAAAIAVVGCALGQGGGQSLAVSLGPWRGTVTCHSDGKNWRCDVT